jgi:hypothetical protein
MFVSAFILLPISIFHVNPITIALQDGDPWEDAVSRAITVLSEHPNFVVNLQSYQATAADINRYLGIIEQRLGYSRRCTGCGNTWGGGSLGLCR